RSRHPRDLHSFPTRRSSDLLIFKSFERLQYLRAPIARRAAEIAVEDFEHQRMRKHCGVPIGEDDDAELLFRHHGNLSPHSINSRSEEHTSELQSLTNIVCRL